MAKNRRGRPKGRPTRTSKKTKRNSSDNLTQEKSSTGTTEAAAEHVAEEPASPIAQEPASPIAQEPASPVTQEPASPVTQEPASPVAQEPASPVAEEPVENAKEKSVPVIPTIRLSPPSDNTTSNESVSYQDSRRSWSHPASHAVDHMTEHETALFDNHSWNLPQTTAQGSTWKRPWKRTELEEPRWICNNCYNYLDDDVHHSGQEDPFEVEFRNFLLERLQVNPPLRRVESTPALWQRKCSCCLRMKFCFGVECGATTFGPGTGTTNFTSVAMDVSSDSMSTLGNDLFDPRNPLFWS
jgi:hypothetical protein